MVSASLRRASFAGVLAAGMLWVSGVPFAAPPPKAQAARALIHQTTHRGVWLVERPSDPRASLIKKLERGTTVSVLVREKPWVRVALRDGSGQGGYLLQRYLKPASPKAANRAISKDGGAETVASLEGPIAEDSGYRQTNVPKVWLVGDPERVKDTLIMKMEKGDALKILAAGETWLHVQTTDGTRRRGYVMAHWTVPATYRAFRGARERASLKVPAPKPQVRAAKKAKTAPVKAARVAEALPPKATTTGKSTHASSPDKTAAKTPTFPYLLRKPQATPKKARFKLKLAGVGLSSTEGGADKSNASNTPSAEPGAASDEVTAFKLEHGLLILFVLSLGGLIYRLTRRRKGPIDDPDTIETIGQVTLGQDSSLTLVRVPGKLLVVARTPQAIDVVDQIEGTDVTSADAGKILESAARRNRQPRMPTPSPPIPLASARNTVPAVVRHRARSFPDTGSSDPFQLRLDAARARLHTVMGA